MASIPFSASFNDLPRRSFNDMAELPMALDGGDVAGIVGGSVTVLGVIGGGLKWLFTSRSKREQWIEGRIQQHVSKIESRLAIAERRADHLGFAFQLVASELARLDPGSDILRRAQMIIEGVQGVFAGDLHREVGVNVPGELHRDLPTEHADLLDELHERTKA